MSDIASIRLPSRFDYAYHKQFVEAYTKYVEDGITKGVILDFSQVEYLDSSALGMMVLMHKRMKEKNKAVTVKSARGATDEILRMANMHKIFEFI
jgi:HptB-dependent secretion and biofilm anti anti-sigma factor